MGDGTVSDLGKSICDMCGSGERYKDALGLLFCKECDNWLSPECFPDRPLPKSSASSDAKNLHGWQKIETAPKDGRKVDVWFNGAGRITDMYYRTKGLEGWCRDHGFPQQTSVFFDSPTHWMPIPEAPK